MWDEFNIYIDLIQNAYKNYFNYLLNEIKHPAWDNYLYWLIAISIMVWVVEIVIPWRRKQALFRKGFWLDAFYLFFNFFLVSLIGYHALSEVGVKLFNDILYAFFGIENLVAIKVQTLSVWLQLFIMFLIADFIQWWVHRLLHRVPFLWKIHQVHHSVKEMGFAAHFRFHFMETIIYKSIQYIPLAMIGFGIDQFIVVHLFALLIGHLNHANINVDYGVFRYVFNNPKMHIWHHAKELPPEHKYGMNFGLSLSIWDYLFKTVYIPTDGKDLEIGFVGDEVFPKDFKGQILYPFKKVKS
ncbi:MAG: sterol desaturase family protein [Flavobacteriaceae bacterium]|nr:sterol desaturase family protein [Flavobacteriaceae bacterium]